jgi:glycerol-3-phosphate acyltransferase PlsY
MTFWPVTILCLVGAYLVGSIPFGVMVGRLRGVDPRTVGSGNTGATNVWRALGPKLGLLVLLLDALKGFLPVFLARGPWFVDPTGPQYAILPSRPILYPFPPAVIVLVGLAAMAGHNWPVFLKFKGGKGVATGLGVLFALDWRVAVLVLIVFGITLAITRYVSVASTVTTVLTPMWFAVFEHGQPRARANIVFAMAGALFIIYKHRANYKRLLAGTEAKVGVRTAGSFTTRHSRQLPSSKSPSPSPPPLPWPPPAVAARPARARGPGPSSHGP